MKTRNRIKIEDKKSKIVQARLTPKEYEELAQKAKLSNLKVSDLIRQAVKKTKTWTARDKKVESGKICQLARIGNNLNQVARWCNTYKSDANSAEVISCLIAIEHELKKALK